MPADKPSKTRKCPSCRQDKPHEAFYAGDTNCGTCREIRVRNAAAINRRRAQVFSQKAKQETP